jgi:hypothetical protein
VTRNKVGRNDPCWCGSGIKYKKCHLAREGEPELPIPALANRLQRFFKAKQCLHPLASRDTCGKVVAAYTIQRKGPLEDILDDSGHCLTFFPPIESESEEPHRRGWKEASSFAGFCERHDGPTFAPLETVPFIASPEQCFLLAYRAECHELYQKLAADKSHEPMRQFLDRGKSPEIQRAIQQMQSWQGAGVRKGLAESQRNKARMDAELRARDYGVWSRLFIRFEGPVSVVSTGAPSPNRSLSGTVLQTLHDPSAQIQRLYLGVVRASGGGAVVLLWRSEDPAPASFTSDLRKMPEEKLSGILIQFMFAYIENSYFSATWWQSLSDEHKRHVRKLATMGNPYYASLEYVPELPVPWRIIYIGDQWPAG